MKPNLKAIPDLKAIPGRLPDPPTAAEAARAALNRAAQLTDLAVHAGLDGIETLRRELLDVSSLPGVHPGIKDAFAKLADRLESDGKHVMSLMERSK